MKNARLAGAAAVALTAALTLSACLPPHQNDSDQPFENNQTGLSTPVLDDGTGETHRFFRCTRNSRRNCGSPRSDHC